MRGPPPDLAIPPDLLPPPDITTPLVIVPTYDLQRTDFLPPPPSGREVYMTRVGPILDGMCAACHSAVGGAGPPFLKPTAYESLLAYPNIITRDTLRSLAGV